MGAFEQEEALRDAGCVVDYDGYVWASGEEEFYDNAINRKKKLRKRLGSILHHLKNNRWIRKNGHIIKLKHLTLNNLRNIYTNIALTEWFVPDEKIQQVLDLIEKEGKSRNETTA